MHNDLPQLLEDLILDTKENQIFWRSSGSYSYYFSYGQSSGSIMCMHMHYSFRVLDKWGKTVLELNSKDHPHLNLLLENLHHAVEIQVVQRPPSKVEAVLEKLFQTSP